MPTVPTVAQPIGTSEIELESGHTTIRAGFLHLSRPFALLGLPTVSLPFAWVNGLPLGVQVAAPFGADTQALNMAQWIEGVVKRTA
jgi:aspartyl-tRNA(Asn)/glutamyl-tRNA(Gln) amidotransferase subunit A